MVMGVKRVSSRKALLISAAAMAAATLGSTVKVSVAAITVNGTYSADFGNALVTQTINTDYGDGNGGADTSGSELDAGYGVIESGNLYLLLTGDFQDNGNALNIIIADGRMGESTFKQTGSPMGNMNGSVFSPAFGNNNGATYAISVNDSGGTVYTDVSNLFAGATTSTYVGDFAANNNAANTLTMNLNGNDLIESLNNSHISTMGAAGTATNQTVADDVQTGFEIAIPLSLLGNPSGNIEVLTDIGAGANGGRSNQFLPGRPVGSGNSGSGVLPADAGYFTVTQSAPIYWAGSANTHTGNSMTWDVENNQNWYNTSGATDYENGDSVIFDDTGAPNYTVTLNTTVTPNSVTINNSAGNYVISGSGTISGVSNLLKEGSDNLTLETANSYTGGTTIGNGTLIVGNSSAIPTDGSLTVTGGTLDLGGFGATVGALIGSGTILNNGGTSASSATLTYAGSTSATSTFSGTISDGSQQTGLTVNSGTLDLTGTPSYSGTTTLAGGTLQIGGAHTETISGNFNAGAGNLTVGDGNAAGLNLTFGGQLNYTGTTQIDSYATMALGSAAYSIASTKISVYGTLSDDVNTFTIGGGTAAQTLTGGQSNAIPHTAGNAGTVTTGSGGYDTLAIGANGTLAPGDPGNVLATITVNGNVNLGGNLVLLADPNDPAATNAEPIPNDVLVLTGLATLGGTLTVTGTSNTAFKPGDSYNLINADGGFTGSFSTLALPALSPGLTWTVTDSGIYYNIAINAQTLYWDNAANTDLWDINTSANWNETGDVNPADYSDGDVVNFDDAHNTGPNATYTVTLNTTVNPGSVTVNNSAGNYVISGTGDISGATSLLKEGSDSLTLATTNSYSGGTQIGNGTLIVGAPGGLPTGGKVSFGDASGDSGTLDLGGNGATVSSLSTIGTGAQSIINNGGSPATLTFAGGTSADSFSGNIGNGTSTTAFTLNSGTGELTLTGTLNYTGATTLTAGTLQIGGGPSNTLNGNFNAGAGNLVVGTGGTSPISLTLNGTLAYTGTTKIDSYATMALGTASSSIASSSISVYGSLTAAASTFTIGGGAAQILTGGHAPNDPGGAGNTSIVEVGGGTGTLVVDANGTVFPYNPSENAVGTLTVDGNANLNGGGTGGTLEVRLDPTTSGHNDELIVTGAAELGGILNAATPFNAGVFSAGESYTVINATGGLTGSFSSIDTPTLTGNLTWIETQTTDSYKLTISTPILYWSDAQGAAPNNEWDINTTANWNNTVSTVDYVDGDTVIFDDAHNTGGSYNVNLDTTVNPFSVTVNNSAGNYVISGSGTISGAASLLKEGIGTLTLDTNNSYTGGNGIVGFNGGTTIGNGTLIVGNSSAIPTGGPLNFGDGTNTGTLDLGGFGATVDSLYTATLGSGVILNNGGTSASSAALTFVNGTSTFSGTIKDGSSQTALTVNSGSLLLSGALSYTGNTTLAGGTLAFNGTQTLTGNFSAGSGNLVVGDGNGTTAASVTLNTTVPLAYTGNTNINSYSTLSLGAANTSVASSSITVYGTLNAAASTFTIGGGAAAQTLYGGEYYLGSAGEPGIVEVGGGTGTLAVGAKGTLYPTNTGTLATLTVNGNVSLSGGGTLEFQVDPDTTGVNDELVLTGGSGVATLTGGTLDVTALNADAFTSGESYTLISSAFGSISGSFATIDTLPTLVGAGLSWHETQTANSYTIYVGPAVTSLYWNDAQGVSPNNLWDINTTANWNNTVTSPVVYSDGSAVYFTDTNGPGGSALPAGAYNVQLNTTVNPASVTVNNSAGNYVISGTGHISGTASLLKEGSDSLTLSTANSYTGGTTIGNGTLIVGNSSAISTGSSVTLGDGTNSGTLDLGGIGATVDFLFVPAGSTGTITNNGAANATLTFETDGSNFSGLIKDGSKTTALTVASGILTLLGANNTFSGGATVSSGAYLIGGATNAFGEGVLTANGTVRLGGFNQGVGSLQGSNSGAITNTSGTAATLSFGGSGTYTYSGSIADGISSDSLSLNDNNDGTQILNGPLSYSGTTTINNGGTLQISGANTDVLNGNITGNDYLTVGDGTTATNLTLGGAASSVGGYIEVKNNSSLTISSTGSMSGAQGVGIDAGATLTANGTLASSVTDNGLLDGTGNVTGNVMVSASGTLSPGNSLGTLTVNGIVTLGGTFSAQIDPTNSESPPNGQLVVTGGSNNVIIGGALDVTAASGTLAAGDSYTLISAAGTVGIEDGSGVQAAFTSVSLPSAPAGTTWASTLLNDHPGNYQTSYNVSLVANASIPTGFTAGVPYYKTALGSSYTGYYIQDLGGRHTDVQFLGGTVSTGTNLAVQFTNRSGSNPDMISDVATINGTGTDTYVLELNYIAADVTNGTLSPVLAVEHSNVFEAAVLLDPTQHEVAGAYTNADDVLGDYGIDPTNHEVWAVLDYSAGDKFGVYQRIPGDLTGSGTVTPSDLGLVQTNLFGSTGGLWSRGDFQGNGSPSDTVTPGDLALVQTNLFANEPTGGSEGAGGGLITSSPVPEPGSLGLLAVGALGMILRGRKKKV
jgi:fibronectin-binding autotransporter adhesin